MTPTRLPMISVVEVARVCHEANRAYCEALGDFSQLPWRQAPPWLRDSVIDGVKFHADEPSAGDAASHENWCRHKQEDGWVYGPTKEPRYKTHPNLVPFSQLPEEQQTKDVLFRSIVLSLLPLIRTTANSDSQKDRPAANHHQV